MRAYIDVTGRNEDEAIANALAQLNMDRDDVSVEILERAKSGFLGIGSCPAKVRVSYGPEEEPVIPEPRAEKKSEPRAEKPRAEKAEKPKAEKKPANKPAAEKAVKEEAAEPAPAAVEDLGEEVNDEKAEAIRTFLSGLLAQMDCTAEVKVYLPEKGRYKVLLVGDNLGALIGRRGEVLDAIQQLTGYAVNRTGGRVRIHLDAEGYREKREQSLQRLAHKVAVKVVKYRRNVMLEPMNAYERHVIHTALQNESGVTTYSTGVDPNRRVVVAYDRDKK